jgi:hypothetical protein
MKQHITVEQLNELSDKEKKKLQKWWTPYYGNEVACEKRTWIGINGIHGHKNYLPSILLANAICNCQQNLRENKKDHFPLLSIGQMIEFLENKFGKGMGIYGYPANHSPKVPNGGYAIKIIPEENDVGIFGSRDGYLSEGQEELCDALWEAVKEVLEKNETMGKKRKKGR